jgi:Ca-activated chloride channel family protein
MWARAHVRTLEDRYAAGTTDRAALEKAIVATSLRFGVLCRFTAFVAVDVKEVVNPGGKVHRVTQPVEAAAGWAMLGTDDADAELCSSSYLTAMPRSRRFVPSGGMAMFSTMSAAAPEDYDAEESVDSCLMEFDDAAAAPACATPPPAPPSPAKKLQSFLGRVREALGGGVGAPVPLDLSAYRRRAQEMLDRLQQGTADRATALGVLSVQLAELVDDLRSVGAPDADIRPLVDLLDALRAAPADVTQRWSQAESVLTAFAQAAPAPARREGFWK